MIVKLFGATKYTDEHLEDMARHFDEKAAIQ